MSKFTMMFICFYVYIFLLVAGIGLINTVFSNSQLLAYGVTVVYVSVLGTALFSIYQDWKNYETRR